MANRIAAGWHLLSQSWSIVRQDKTLLLFPVMSSLACLVVVASFVLPLVLTGASSGPALTHRAAPEPWQSFAFDLAFAFYFANYLVIVFFNTALVSCALMRFTAPPASQTLKPWLL